MVHEQGTKPKGKAATSYHSLRGGWDDPNCARLPNPPLTFKGGLVDPRLRASNEHILIVRVPRAGGRPGYPSHPSQAARCASTGIVPATPSPFSGVPPTGCSNRLSSKAAARACQLKGSSRGCPLLRASNEHILIVRVPRAGGRPGYPSHPSEAARCASTEDHQAPSPLCSARKKGTWPLPAPFFSSLSPWDDGLGLCHHLAIGTDLGSGGLTA